jgi:acetyl-CoA carboxylase biotin carboxyl carrier protein
VNIKELKEMINLMNENNLTELEIEKEGLRIRLKKTIPSEILTQPPAIFIEKEKIAEIERPSQITEKVKTVEIKAPMVGTFYRAPSPEAPPFVEIGQIIEIGQVVCIIEAMKLMNEIKSEIRGRILEIFVENGEPVEFGQPLFLVEPL